MENLGRIKGQVNTNFWKGKKVFLTGHTGFKGSWLSLWMLDMGAIVKGYALEPNTNPSLFKLLNLSKNMESEIEEIKREMLKTIFPIIKYKDDELIKCEIHRWRYANIAKNNKYKYLLDIDNRLAAIGDWCIRGTIESGFLSANALYNELIKII